jgi:acetate---CoA ligase (ADP-forming)
MQGFFNPETVAIAGVSENEDNLGRKISANMQDFAFDGIVYEVGPRGGHIFGRRIYRSVSDIPDHVDLAVVLTPAPTVPDIMTDCGRKGIRRVVVETAGFGEYGAEGKVLQERIHAIAREHDIRFIGPNCIGVMNRHTGLTAPFISLDRTVRPGRISVITQSGGVAVSILNVMASEGLGLSKMVSVGNKLDVDENDLLEYFMVDPDTDIICMYLEGIRDGRRLIDLARQSTKPILVHKSNIGGSAHGIATSHTGSLAADDQVVDAALRQAGIARFRNAETLAHYLKALPMPPLAGNRLAVLSRSGGHAVMAADEIDLCGFQLSQLPQSFLDEIQTYLRANVIRITNPIDLGDLFDLDLYARIAERTIAMDGVDGMVYLHTYAAATEGEKSMQLFTRLHALARQADKPIAIHAATTADELSRLKRAMDGPLFSEPSDAVRSLALLRDFRHQVVRARTRPDGPADTAAVRAIVDACRSERRDPLIQEAMAIGNAYGVPMIPSTLVTDEEAAVAAADALGYPVAMKIVSRDISHKSDFGGVQLNLRTKNSVRSAWQDMMRSVATKAAGAHVEGALVQPMVLGDRDVIVGAKLDPNFGHVVLVGMGGIFVEVFRDTALRVAPFQRDTAEAMLRELRIYPILSGARGQVQADIPALIEAIVAVARLVTDFPEIVELDLNPVRVLPAGQGALALDARMTLARG